MKEIIKVSKQTIGAEEISSVNAREIHEYLGVKTVFANWIQRAIKKYDFLENVDYVRFSKNGKAKNNAVTKEYIVTIDMGKELAMLENNAKGKETRKYFIACEKKVVTSTMIDSSKVLEILSQQNMMMLQQNDMILKLMDKMANIETSIKDVSHVRQNYIMLRQENRADYITPAQADKIIELIEDAGKYISKYHRLDMHTSKRLIFGKFNSKFAIKKYNHLKAVNFNKAVAYLTTLRDKARLQTDVTYKKMVDEIIDIFEEEE